MNKILYHTVKLECDALTAFSYFIENEKLQSWLTARADVGPVVGGKYELFWVPEEAEYDSTIGCKITAIEPRKLLAFEWKGPRQFSGFMNDADPLTHVTVSFIPVGTADELITEIHLIHTGWRDTGEWEEARLWFEKAWSFAFDELKKRIND
ncbi:MAG: SRPBCC domain-containing protein [bacterium]|nr:SRPBCC domain-containing protein [bacterium]